MSAVLQHFRLLKRHFNNTRREKNNKTLVHWHMHKCVKILKTLPFKLCCLNRLFKSIHFKNFIELSFDWLHLMISQPNWSVHTVTHPSLHPNCHYQIIHVERDLKIHYRPPFTCEVWHYKDSERERAFGNTNIDKEVLNFNKIVLNTLSNFIPHLLIGFDDKYLPCFSSCSSDITFPYFFILSKVWSMLHRGSVGTSSE